MRGDLRSRPVGDVLNEALALLETGVKELLIISQDTSAYGVDIRYQTGFFKDAPSSLVFMNWSRHWLNWLNPLAHGFVCIMCIPILQ